MQLRANAPIDLNIPFTEVGILNYLGAQPAAILGITDLFSAANAIALKNNVEAEALIRVSHWTEIEVERIDCTFDTQPSVQHDLRYIIVPYGKLIPPLSLKAHVQWLQDAYSRGATLAAAGAGTFLLAETGLAADRLVAVHADLADQFRKYYSDVQLKTDSLMIDDGDLITSIGLLSWSAISLTIIARVFGPAIMADTAQNLSLDLPKQDQVLYRMFIPKLHHGDDAILKVQRWLQSHPREASALEMAEVAGLGARTFLRRFIKASGLRPSVYLQRLRVQKAREMLELTQKSIDEIAWLVGYKDASAFSKVFQKQIGITPGDYRSKLQRRQGTRLRRRGYTRTTIDKRTPSN